VNVPDMDITVARALGLTPTGNEIERGQGRRRQPRERLRIAAQREAERARRHAGERDGRIRRFRRRRLYLLGPAGRGQAQSTADHGCKKDGPQRQHGKARNRSGSVAT
jgi:hypothetical protein